MRGMGISVMVSLLCAKRALLAVVTLGRQVRKLIGTQDFDPVRTIPSASPS
jgi:hypothetical protein